MPVTRQSGNIGKCFCKVGACRKYGSKCKRCKCSCDGVSPLEAMRSTSGRQKKQKKSRCSKQLTIAEQVVQKMPTRSRSSTQKRSWADT